MHFGDDGWGMGVGMLFIVLFWILAILGAVYLWNLLSKQQRVKGDEETALDILKKRYAGEK